MQLQHLVVVERAVLTDVPLRRDHEVAGRVGVLVQQRDRLSATADDQALFVVACDRITEDAARLLVGRLDVLEAPGRPQLLHPAESRAGDPGARPGPAPSRLARGGSPGRAAIRPWP